MSWERGFVVCKDEYAEVVENSLAEQSVCLRLTSLEGETAFAFAGRAIPSIDSNMYFACAVDGRNSSYSHSSLSAFRPLSLIPQLGLTCGITLGKDYARLRDELPNFAAYWDALGPPSDVGRVGDVTGFRWDLDEYDIDDPQVASVTQSLKSLQRLLGEHKIRHRIVLFDNGFPEVFGDLPETSDVFTGPATCLSLRWQSSSDKYNSVTANDAEFMLDGDDVPDSQLWAL